jgi:hypothetical protein
MVGRATVARGAGSVCCSRCPRPGFPRRRGPDFILELRSWIEYRILLAGVVALHKILDALAIDSALPLRCAHFRRIGTRGYESQAVLEVAIHPVVGPFDLRPEPQGVVRTDRQPGVRHLDPFARMRIGQVHTGKKLQRLVSLDGLTDCGAKRARSGARGEDDRHDEDCIR